MKQSDYLGIIDAFTFKFGHSSISKSYIGIVKVEKREKVGERERRRGEMVGPSYAVLQSFSVANIRS
jgi:hypothetical protein